MSKLSVQERNIAIGVGVGVGTVLVSWWVWKRLTRKPFPHKWEEIGEVSELMIFPVKSARGIQLQTAQATIYGLESNLIEDRSFMVIKDGGQFITSRHIETLAAVKTSWSGHTLTLAADGYEDVSVDVEKDCKKLIVWEVNLRGIKLPGVDCGDKVADWLTRVLHKGEVKLRLVYKGNVLTNRPSTKPDFHDFTNYRKSDRCYYSDNCSYMIGSQSSLDDLNRRLPEPVTMETFRPNFIVKNSEPYDEDDWVYIRIGPVVLRRLKPCERCVLVTVDPLTGKRRENDEPLTTLKKYHLLKEPPELAKRWETRPIFGLHASIESTGTVSVGDKVFIARASVHPELKGY